MEPRSHSGTVPYVEYDEVEAVCPECGAAFRSTETLDAHVRESHATAQGATPRARSVTCSVCGASLPSVSALQRHNTTAHVA